MTDVAVGHDVHAEHAPAPPPTGLRRLLAPGWLRAIWMSALFFGIGAGITVLIRWLETWHRIWPGSVIVTVELAAVPKKSALIQIARSQPGASSRRKPVGGGAGACSACTSCPTATSVTRSLPRGTSRARRAARRAAC